MVKPESTIRYRRILLIEDDYLIARELAQAFEKLGAHVIGPAGSLGGAITLAETADFDCCLLDINLKGVEAYPVADLLMKRGLPFAFVTGYDKSVIPERYHSIPLIHKPVDAHSVARALAS
jgi:CheY-like chemotaxis protein